MVMKIKINTCKKLVITKTLMNHMLKEEMIMLDPIKIIRTL